jgi:hypothetical protein
MAPVTQVRWPDFADYLKGTDPPECFFAKYAISESNEPVSPCDGRLVRCHLIPRQRLRETAQYKALRSNRARQFFLYDPRSWVWGCGGGVGLAGHHGQFDTNFRIRVPRCHLPPGVEELAVELDLLWYLDKKFGPRPVTSVSA